MRKKGTSTTNDATHAVSVGEFTAVANGSDPDSNPIEIAIRMKAYELFLLGGERHGDDLSDWLEAERIVRSQVSWP